MKKFITLIILASFFGALISCERETDQVGPTIGPTQITTALAVSDTDVDFESGESTTFSMELTSVDSWSIVITGESSGAVKTISGSSPTIEEVWVGNSDDLPLFEVETVKAVITVKGLDENGETLYLYDSVSFETASKQQVDVLIADFESGMSTTWDNFGHGFQEFSASFFNAGEGNRYMAMAGEAGWDKGNGEKEYLIGYVEFFASDFGASTYDLPAGQDIYFNFLLKDITGGDGDFIIIQFREDDNEDGLTGDNSTGDLYSYEMDVTNEDWKGFSLKYDAETLTLGSAGTQGLPSPHKISSVRVLMLNEPDSDPASGGMDYISFTIDEPLFETL